MAHATLPLLSTPHFPQTHNSQLHPVFAEILNSFVTRIEAHPLLGSCDYENEFVDCREKATVHHLGLEMEFCAHHFGKVVGRG